MDTTTAATMVKMLESVPELLQEGVVEHMRDYIEDIRNDTQWKKLFSQTQNKLIVVARKARQEIAQGKARPMNFEKL